MARDESIEIEEARNRGALSATSGTHADGRPRLGDGGTTAMLFLLGIGLIGAGVAIVLAPEYSWTVHRVGRELAALGVLPGTLFVGGLITCALGVLSRSRVGAPSHAGSDPVSGDSEFLLVADQLATDQAQVLTSLLQVSEELAALGEAQRTALATPAQGESGSADQHNAIYRLAASVDQLHARIDERMHALDVLLRNRLESVTAVLEKARTPAPATPQPVQAAQPVAAAPVAQAPAPPAPPAPSVPLQPSAQTAAVPPPVQPAPAAQAPPASAGAVFGTTPVAPGAGEPATASGVRPVSSAASPAVTRPPSNRGSAATTPKPASSQLFTRPSRPEDASAQPEAPAPMSGDGPIPVDSTLEIFDAIDSLESGKAPPGSPPSSELTGEQLPDEAIRRVMGEE